MTASPVGRRGKGESSQQDEGSDGSYRVPLGEQEDVADVGVEPGPELQRLARRL